MVICVGLITIEGIAQDFKVHLSWHILYGMIKAENNIASITTQRDYHTSIICQALFSLSGHNLTGVAHVVIWHIVDKLTWCRHKFKHTTNIRRLCKYAYCDAKHK